MPDLKITQLDEITSISGTDLLTVVINPSDTPANKKITWNNLQVNQSTASESGAGVVELATLTEVNAGTDSTRAVTPDALAGSYAGTKTIVLKVLADNEDLSTGNGKMYFTVPEELNGMSLVNVGAHVYTVSTGGTPEVQIHNATDSQDMLSTTVTIDEGENDSMNATTPPVINTGYDDVATGDVLRVDVDTSGTGTKGLEIRMGFRLS